MAIVNASELFVVIVTAPLLATATLLLPFEIVLTAAGAGASVVAFLTTSAPPTSLNLTLPIVTDPSPTYKWFQRFNAVPNVCTSSSTGTTLVAILAK